MTDINTPLLTYPFHIIARIRNYTCHEYIAHTWTLDREVYLIGACMGLLCFTNNGTELYLSISRSPRVGTRRYFLDLKTDFLFYAQRDQRSPPVGIDDIIQYIWLPSGTGFYCNKGDKIYFKVGAMNKSGRDVLYDAFATVYYVEIVSTEHRPQPLVDPEILVSPTRPVMKLSQ